MIHRVKTGRMQQPLHHIGESIYYRKVTRKACDIADKNSSDAATVEPHR